MHYTPVRPPALQAIDSDIHMFPRNATILTVNYSTITSSGWTHLIASSLAISTTQIVPNITQHLKDNNPIEALRFHIFLYQSPRYQPELESRTANDLSSLGIGHWWHLPLYYSARHGCGYTKEQIFMQSLVHRAYKQFFMFRTWIASSCDIGDVDGGIYDGILVGTRRQ
ncbi:hypothetical protein NA56DRAFT_701384 [Hyaloscypha hepaticicola]|uniref:Uncharacterized protein n=1 Tax=Hyaloscypha hepaticicola TaxID=2082293 RepID=A0A2J6QA35_9HELO|nr:hypothetical protein NA56DRAFT_701384 [Hyaloscypha hepaticicola]